jgi:Domain of unknown function (DUF4252)
LNVKEKRPEMTRPRWIGIALAACLAAPVWAAEADDIHMPVNLDKLADRATETVDVTLDASMLQLASKFLSSEDADEAKAKRIVGKLRGVFVRSFQFDKDGQYSMADVEALRAQLKSPQWTRIVGVRSTKGENSEVYLQRSGDLQHGGDRIEGLFVIAAEPRELTIVHIDGSISPEEFTELEGHMGIPHLGKTHTKGSKTDEKTDKEEE